MKFLLALALVCASTATPIVDLPVSMRQSNWRGSQGEGSCVYATTISLLRWQGRIKTAEQVRKTCGNGSNPEYTAQVFDKLGIRYAYTIGDVKFLEWSMRTRRGCGVVVDGGSHFVTLVYLDAKRAAIMDNNAVDKIKWVSRSAFLAEWRASGAWALAVLYAPAAPLPK